MAIPVNEYPYTDIHELNLDYVLHELQRMQAEIEELKTEVADLDARVTALGG